MALTMGPNIGLLENGAPGEGHYAELMRMWRWGDFLLQPVVKSRISTVPPAAANGDAYIVLSGADVNKIARWTTRLATDQWEFITPKVGWRVGVEDELSPAGEPITYTFDGGDWIVSSEYAGALPGSILDGVEIKNFTETEYTIPATSGAVTVDRTDGGIQHFAPNGDCTIDWSLPSGAKQQLYLQPGGNNVVLTVDHWMTAEPDLITQVEVMVVVENSGGAIRAWDAGGRS